jgi:hypothetical protein
MKNANEIKAQYEANKVVGRSEKCPRKGVFKILSISNGHCFSKPAQMAIVQWKIDLKSTYSTETFEIQIESFKNHPDTDGKLLNDQEIIARELHVIDASTNPVDRQFILKWEVLPIKLTIDILNAALKNGSIKIDLDDLEDFGDDDDFDTNPEF